MSKVNKNRLFVFAVVIGSLSSLVVFNAEKLGLVPLRYHTYERLDEEKFSQQELADLIALHVECFEEDRRKNLYNYYLEVKYPYSDEYFRNYLKEKVEGNLQQVRAAKKTSFRHMQNVTVLKKGADIVGMYNCVPEETLTKGSIMIYNVCLTSGMRGKGIGKSMVTHAIDRCKQKGKDLTLTVYKDNPTAIALYKKLGFTIAPMPSEAGDDFEYFNKYLMVYQPSMP